MAHQHQHELGGFSNALFDVVVVTLVTVNQQTGLEIEYVGKSDIVRLENYFLVFWCDVLRLGQLGRRTV